jgi:hypothetical protein
MRRAGLIAVVLAGALCGRAPADDKGLLERAREISDRAATLERARAVAAQTEAELRRTQVLFDKGAVNQAELDAARDKSARARVEVVRATAALQKLLAGAGDARLREELDRVRQNARASEQRAALALREAQRNAEEARLQRDRAEVSARRALEALRRADEARQKELAARVAHEALVERTARLEKQLAEVVRELRRLKGKDAPVPKKAPPGKVEGRVTRTDPSGLVTLSVGSDAGLARGHTLEVFRLGPTPSYVGRIEIVSVTPRQAVGRVVSKLLKPIQVGDTAASDILGP